MVFFIGVLVVENYNKDVIIWKERVYFMFNRMMFLLSYVVDGLMEEGVVYGLYMLRFLI